MNGILTKQPSVGKYPHTKRHLLTEWEKNAICCEHFKNALKLNPNDAEAKHNFERALAEANKEDALAYM